MAESQLHQSGIGPVPGIDDEETASAVSSIVRDVPKDDPMEEDLLSDLSSLHMGSPMVSPLQDDTEPTADSTAGSSGAVKYTPTLLATLSVPAATVAAVQSKLGKGKKPTASATSEEESDPSPPPTPKQTRRGSNRKAKSDGSDGSGTSVASTPEVKRKTPSKKKEPVVSSKATPKAGSKGTKPATKPKPKRDVCAKVDSGLGKSKSPSATVTTEPAAKQDLVSAPVTAKPGSRDDFIARCQALPLAELHKITLDTMRLEEQAKQEKEAKLAAKAAKAAKKIEEQKKDEFKTPPPPAPKPGTPEVVKPVETEKEKETEEEVMDTSDTGKKDPAPAPAGILQPMDAGPKDMEPGDSPVPLRLRSCLDNLLSDQDKATIGDEKLLRTMRGIELCEERFPNWFPGLLDICVRKVTREAERDCELVAADEILSQGGALTQAKADLETFQEFQLVVKKRKKAKAKTPEGKIAKALARVEEEAAKKQEAEKETVQQETTAAEATVSCRERREMAREAMLMKACKVIYMKSGHSKEEADKEMAKVSGMTMPERQALVESTVKANTASAFKYFKPQCLDDCRKDWRTKTAPPVVYPDGVSDDEEWCKEDPLGDSVSEYYVQAMEKMRCSDTALVSKMMKSKLTWAASRWTPDTPCPFEVCVINDKARPSPKTWITKVRFLRHLTEWHFNHYPRYDCVAVKGRKNDKCPNGDQFFRRGDLVRHLGNCHNTGIQLTVPRVNALHQEMWERYQSGSKDFCNQDVDCDGAGYGKVRGFFKWNSDQDKLHIADGPNFDAFMTYSSKSKGRRSLKRPAHESTQQAKKPRAQSTERKGVLEKVAPHGSGVTFSSKRTDWSAGPGEGVHVSSIQQRYPEQPEHADTEETFDEAYPDSSETMKAGEETQVLDKNLKDKRTSGKGSQPVRKEPPAGKPPAKGKPAPPKQPVAQPVAPVPEGYLVVQRKELPAFAPSNKASFTIQQGMVNTWQDGFNQIVMDMHQRATDLSLGAISEIHAEEKAVLKTAADTAAAESVAAAQKAADKKMADAIEKETKATKGQGYLEKRLAESRALWDNENIKFEACFGHELKEWDGSRETIDRWLREMDAQE